MLVFIHRQNMRNALMRNSTWGLEQRELSAGVRQRKEVMELALEHLSELYTFYDDIIESRRRRYPPLYGEDIRIPDTRRFRIP